MDNGRLDEAGGLPEGWERSVGELGEVVEGEKRTVEERRDRSDRSRLGLVHRRRAKPSKS